MCRRGHWCRSFFFFFFPIVLGGGCRGEGGCGGSYVGHLMPPRLAASLVGAVGCHIRTGDDRQRPTTCWRGHRLTQIIHASGGGDTGVKGGVWVTCGVFHAPATCSELVWGHGMPHQRPVVTDNALRHIYTSTHRGTQLVPFGTTLGYRGLSGSYVGFLLPVRLAAGLFGVLGCHHSATQHPWRP